MAKLDLSACSEVLAKFRDWLCQQFISVQHSLCSLITSSANTPGGAGVIELQVVSIRTLIEVMESCALKNK